MKPKAVKKKSGRYPFGKTNPFMTVFQFADKNKRHIYTGLAVAGLATSTYLTARTALRVKERVAELEEEGASTKEIVLEVAKLCAGTGLVIIGTGASIILIDISATKDINTLMAALAMQSGNYVAIADEIKQAVGDEKGEEIIKNAAEKAEPVQLDYTREGYHRSAVEHTGTGDLLFYIPEHREFFRASYEAVVGAMQATEHEINNKNGEANENFVRANIPLPLIEVEEADTWGWNDRNPFTWEIVPGGVSPFGHEQYYTIKLSKKEPIDCYY